MIIFFISRIIFFFMLRPCYDNILAEYSCAPSSLATLTVPPPPSPRKHYVFKILTKPAEGRPIFLALYEMAQKKHYRECQSVNLSIGMCVVCPPPRAHVTVTYIPIDPALSNLLKIQDFPVF